MTCDQLSGELVAYHFGTVTPDEREAIEEHLLSCPSCCRAYVVVKRSIETAPAAPRPSASARARLRGAVADELIRRERRRAIGWWERPLAVGFAAVAVATALFTTRALAESPAHGPRSLSSQASPR